MQVCGKKLPGNTAGVVNMGVCSCAWLPSYPLAFTPHFSSTHVFNVHPCHTNTNTHTPPRYRTLKVIATLGPATWTPEGMRRLLDAGVDIVSPGAC